MSAKFPKITEAGLDDLRSRIGVKIENTVEPWNYEATRDAIRHYAHGIGDDNRLWCDPEYAAKTKYGSLVALPSFLFTTSRLISGYCGGLSGVHAMWAGADQYQTSDGTAVAGEDYVATSGTLTFPANTLQASISVSVSRGTTDQVFSMTLSNPVGANIQDGQAVGTIKASEKAGCGFGVGPANLIGFYVLTWAGLVGMKAVLRRPKRSV